MTTALIHDSEAEWTSTTSQLFEETLKGQPTKEAIEVYMLVMVDPDEDDNQRMEAAGKVFEAWYGELKAYKLIPKEKRALHSNDFYRELSNRARLSGHSTGHVLRELLYSALFYLAGTKEFWNESSRKRNDHKDI